MLSRTNIPGRYGKTDRNARPTTLPRIRIVKLSLARPDVAHLMFRVYDRSVHPELLRACAAATVKQPDFSALVQICDAGHIVIFRHQSETLCEITSTAEQPLPQHKQIVSRRLRGHRQETIRLAGGRVLYHLSFQLERLEPDVFLHHHEELLDDSRRALVAHQFGSINRFAPPPLSFVLAEPQQHSLLLQAFHTFPGNCAVVKTQSLFEIV